MIRTCLILNLAELKTNVQSADPPFLAITSSFFDNILAATRICSHHSERVRVLKSKYGCKSRCSCLIVRELAFVLIDKWNNYDKLFTTTHVSYLLVCSLLNPWLCNSEFHKSVPCSTWNCLMRTTALWTSKFVFLRCLFNKTGTSYNSGCCFYETSVALKVFKC